MSNACHDVVNRSSSQDSIRATEEIKRDYLQLMTMKNQDVRGVVDAFVVELANIPLTRAVSVEEDQVAVREQPIVTMSVPAPSNSKPATEMIIVANGKTAMTPAMWQDMFSPCTDDMKSVPIEPEEEYEDDDLRRTVGSNDYDDQAEERDAPEAREESHESVPLRNMVYNTWGGTCVHFWVVCL